MSDRSLKVMLDNGIFSHSEFSEWCVQPTKHRWVDGEVVLPIKGIRRKLPQQNIEYEQNICALFTVGRLIREGRIEAYDYDEIQCERIRDRIPSRICNALQGCHVNDCPAAIERSKFRQTINSRESISKGGKRDRKRNPGLGNFTQIGFFEWLFSLSSHQVERMINANARIIRRAPRWALTDFEINSLRNIEWFKFLCSRSGTTDNYPDVFHVWTAERNGLDVFLTLDAKLTRFIANIRREKKKTITFNTEVLLPLELLHRLGITNPDPVPLDHDRFYNLGEVLK
jgi:hypothetical protein